MSAASSRTCSSNITSAAGCRAIGELLARKGGAGVCQQQDALAFRGKRFGPDVAPDRDGAAAHTISGAPSTHVPRLPKLAALHFRAEEKAVEAVRSQSRGAGNAAHSALIVALRRSSAASAPSASRHGIALRKLLHRVEHDRAFGDRSRLVEEHDIDPSESFDRWELLHEHLPARQRDGREPEGEARKQDEPFRHHRDDAGNGSRDRVVASVMLAELADRKEHRGRDERPLHVAQNAC